MLRLRGERKRVLDLGIAFALSLALMVILRVAISPAQASSRSAVDRISPQNGTAGTVRLEPVSTLVENGQTFRIYVKIEGAVDLGAFQLELDYDPNILEVPKQVNPMILGGFLGSTGRSPSELVNELNTVAGAVTHVVITTGSSSGPSGDGVLAFVDLKARALGSSALDLVNVEITNTGGGQQSISVENASVLVAASVSKIYLPLVTK